MAAQEMPEFDGSGCEVRLEHPDTEFDRRQYMQLGAGPHGSERDWRALARIGQNPRFVSRTVPISPALAQASLPQ